VAAALTIRRGTRRDVPTILALIRGLADYERLLHECVATAAGIRRDGFGRARYFETLICRRAGRPVGFALYFFTYSTFLARPTLYLEDLFVLPSERGRGAGVALLRALARIAMRRRCGRMEWAVLDWNRPAMRFYRALGAGFRKEWGADAADGRASRATGRTPYWAGAASSAAIFSAAHSQSSGIAAATARPRACARETFAGASAASTAVLTAGQRSIAGSRPSASHTSFCRSSRAFKAASARTWTSSTSRTPLRLGPGGASAMNRSASTFAKITRLEYTDGSMPGELTRCN